MRRILELTAKIEADPSRASQLLNRFVKRHQFPLIEGDNATFFFWDGKPTDAVYLQHWVFGLPSHQPYRRIDGTDAFYLPLELPHKARIEYKIEVERGGRRQWTRDPLNPRRAFDPFGSNSVCPMPGYQDPPWVRPDPAVRHGRMRSFSFHSEVFGDQRDIEVYLPAEFRPHKRYPLLICHDGRDYLRFTDMRTVLDNLIGRHEVAPLIVAFTSGVQRNVEYGANPLQARFLVEELLPALESRYKIEPGPAARGLMGASFGAVSSLFTAWTYPGVFGQVLLQSGSFVFTDIGQHDRGPLFDPVVAFVQRLREDPGRLDSRIYQSCGTFESLIYYNRSLLPLLQSAGLDVRYEEAQDGHNWIGWRDRLRAGLSWIFPGHLWMVYA
ncbi:MAG: hypothetical protein KDK70_33700 [Myxococcales bacterium]|nr:hypothetical protein [Myxococcales bacterium]